jgi:hypothetical protein
MGGCLAVSSLGALIVLLLGIAVPLAGGTDFGGVPRVAGAVMIVMIWLAGISYAARYRQWIWLTGLLLLSPLWFLWYGTSVSDDFTYPEQCSAFADQPWYLLGLLMTPIPLLAYGAARVWQDRA